MAETFQFLQNSQEFAIDLYKATIALNPGNSVHISPFTAQSCAALVLMGATGETALQLSSMLRMEHLSKDAIANKYASLISYLPVSLAGFKVSSHIFQSKRAKLKSEFLEVAVDKFFTEVQRVNFGNSVKSFGKINGWIMANLTRKRQGMIDSNTLTADTALLLANVCYFQGSWLHPFTLCLTSKQPFWVTPYESVMTNMMNNTERFMFYECEKLDAKVIELPYRSSEVTMVLLLPNNQNMLESFEASLDVTNLCEMLSQMTEQFVNLSLPRFKLEAGYHLQRRFLEMTQDSRLFTAEAELDAMFEGGEPAHHHLKIFQRTAIEVNEKGTDTTEAAGMTLTRKKVIRFQTPPPEFKANHPFIYMLMGGANTILFMGCVKNGKFF